MNFSVTRTQRIFFVIISILIGLVCAALLSEGLVRIFSDISPGARRFVIDSGYGVRANEPNVVRSEHYPGGYTVLVSTNSAGMRGTREYSVEKPQNVERVLMLGDSFIYGLGVADNEVVSVMLEDLLNAKSSKVAGYEVINLGVSGFGQAEELVTYRERGRDYEPDTVVLFYYNNDIANNVVSKLFSVVDYDGVVRTENDYLPAMGIRRLLHSFGLIRWLADNSHAWRLIRERVSYLIQLSMLKEQGLEDFSDENTNSLALTKALIAQFVKDIRADGARPIIVIIPKRPGKNSNFPLDAESVEAMGADLVDGRRYLVEDDYLIEGHWNPIGHRKTAERLAELIR